jgi:hypothetical protein
MALTLVEAAKLNSGDVVRSSIIEMFARSSDILRVLPFQGIAGNALKYNREDILPGVGFRGVNEAYTESTGVLNPITETLAIAGGDLDVDRYLIQTMGAGTRASQEGMKVKALSLAWTKTFLKGDSGTEPREFDGLQARIPSGSAQLIDAGATSGGDALSLAKLDEMIDAVDGPTHLVMNKTMRRLLSVAARTTTVGGDIQYSVDEFGRQITTYAGLPILIADVDNANAAILPFTEANPGGGSAASTSIYAMSVGDAMLSGIENGGLGARDLGEQDSKPVLRTRVEWYAGIALFHGKAVARLQGIKNAAVVA